MMIDLSIDTLKRKAGCEHRVTYHDDEGFVTVYHADDLSKHSQFKTNNPDGSRRPWVTEVIDWIRGLHE